MNTKLINTILCMLLATGMLISCKKNTETVPKEKGIMEDPASYVVYIRLKNSSGFVEDWIYDFSLDNKVQTYLISQYDGTPKVRNYEINGDTLKIMGTIVNLTKDNVIFIEDDERTLQQFAFLKKQPTNRFAGKAFTGTYYRFESTVLHPSFFYQFHPTNATKKVGRVFPNADREDSYILIGGVVAIWNNISGYPGDLESMVIIDDKLNVNYRDDINNRLYYGVFSKQ